MANQDFNINEVIASFLNERIDSIFSSIKDGLKITQDSLSIKFKTKYSDYLNNLIERYGKTRSFFIRDEARDLYSFYVPVGLRTTKKVISTANLKEIVHTNKFSTISGSGGSGKSILLRHLLYNSLITKYKVPVFIELRDGNFEKYDIKEFIQKTLSNFGLDLDNNYFEKSLEAGHYIIFLDGFDEIKVELRNNLIKDVESFTKKFSNCNIIITTRPDDRIAGLTLFTNFQILPLSLDQCVQLIEKLPAIEEVKAKFIKDLKGGLFEKHQSFLSNPLLLSIMLLTYGYSADIPNKLSIFYNQAYEALFQRHDALKGAYNRDKRATLDIQEFEKVLSAFCIQSYDNRKFQLSKTEIIEYLEKCKNITNIDFITENFYEDLMQSVCILVQDGLFLAFTHRSFQEYFAAKFISRSSIEVKKKLINKYKANISSDMVIRLTYEMDKDFFDSSIILPFIKELFKRFQITNQITPKIFLAFTKEAWSEFRIAHGVFTGSMNKDRISSMVGFIMYDTQIVDIKTIIKPKVNSFFEKKIELSKTSNTIEVYQTKDLKLSDTFFKELYSGAQYFSSDTLKGLIHVKKIIEVQLKKRKQNLDKILFNK